jgi:hypothetical protein
MLLCYSCYNYLVCEEHKCLVDSSVAECPYYIKDKYYTEK